MVSPFSFPLLSHLFSCKTAQFAFGPQLKGHTIAVKHGMDVAELREKTEVIAIISEQRRNDANVTCLNNPYL